MILAALGYNDVSLRIADVLKVMQNNGAGID